MKVVLNSSVGSRFFMSSVGFNRLIELKGSIGQFGDDGRSSKKSNLLYSLPRDDKDLVQVIEELGLAASDLRAVDMPNYQGKLDQQESRRTSGIDGQ
jgi:hypothetical protein